MVLFTGQRLLHLHNLTGSQVGSYFGHSVAVLDANGDGLDDIAIGAPLHSSPMDKYETGRVYVVYQNENVSHFSLSYLKWYCENLVENLFQKYQNENV